MNDISRTLYIPLYGKAMVSRKGLLLHDPKAEEIWAKAAFPLRRKSRSKWLAYFMAMRARVFDDWTIARLFGQPDTVVLHIGCGLDSRVLRTGNPAACWFDIDFPEVIAEREKHYQADDRCRMLAGNAADPACVDALPAASRAIVLLEGVSMYLKSGEVQRLFEALSRKYAELHILMDVYTPLGVKASRWKNPINDVGVTRVYGIDDPTSVLGASGLHVEAELSLTPAHLVNELSGFDRWFFARMFAGTLAQSMYRLFEYASAR